MTAASSRPNQSANASNARTNSVVQRLLRSQELGLTVVLLLLGTALTLAAGSHTDPFNGRTVNNSQKAEGPYSLNYFSAPQCRAPHTASRCIPGMPAMLQPKEIPGLFWTAAKGWSSDNVPRIGASLAYYTLFSVAPVLVIAIAIAGFFFGAEAVRGEIVGQIQGTVGADGAHALQGLLEGASNRGTGIFALIAGTITFLLASTGVFLELQYALNTIFRVKQQPDVNVSAFVKARLRSFGLVLSLGFVLIVSLAVSAILSAASTYVATNVTGVSQLWQLLNIAVSFSVITLLFALIYRFLPDVKLRWRDVWVGSFMTAALFTVGKQLLGLYLGRFSTTSSYGAAGSVVVLLLWVYYSAQIILFGAELTRVYTERVHGTPPTEAFAVPDPCAHSSSPS